MSTLHTLKCLATEPVERIAVLIVGATLMWPIGGLVHLAALGVSVALSWWNVRKERTQ